MNNSNSDVGDEKNRDSIVLRYSPERRIDELTTLLAQILIRVIAESQVEDAENE